MPNSNSILYRRKLHLHFLNQKLNFYIPGKKELPNALKNYDFKICEIESSYLNSPYRNIIMDHIKFLGNLCTPMYFNHAFWGSMFNVVARKPFNV